MTAVRDGWRLGLRLRDISLQDPGRELVRFSRAVIAVDLLVLAAENGGWYIDQLTVSEGVNLVVERAEDGGLRLLGSRSPAIAEERSEDDVDPLLAWVLSQGRLAVDDVELDWIDRHGPRPAEFHFSAVSHSSKCRQRQRATNSPDRPAVPDLVEATFQSWPSMPAVHRRRPQDWQGTVLCGCAPACAWPGCYRKFDGRRPWRSAAIGSATARLCGEWPHATEWHGWQLTPRTRAPRWLAPVAGTPVLEIDAVTRRFDWRRKDDGWQFRCQ